MEIYFWGTRGSLPASIGFQDIQNKLRSALRLAIDEGLNKDSDIDEFIQNHLPFWMKGTYGTNTPCVEIRDENRSLICDAGTGLRDLGISRLQDQLVTLPYDFHILISHPHWDHIQGFPFFVPLYMKGTRVNIYGYHENLERAFHIQQDDPFFPVKFSDLPSEINFKCLSPGQYHEINGFRVLPKAQRHPGISYGYRIERNGKVVVYSTDSEHKGEEDISDFIEFFRNADLLIFDAQYTFAEACTIKEDWGHSNNVIGVELAQRSGVKHLCLFHMEPTTADEKIDRFLSDTRRLANLLGEGDHIDVSIAWDGMNIKI